MSKEKEDITGRSQLVRNVGASYAGHAVFIVFGFVMPRAIDEQVGQAALGVWDFSWALVNYLNIAMIGIGSSVNRYVARYRAAGDELSLNKTISTVVAVQLAIAVLVFAASMVLAVIIPVQFADRLGELGPVAARVTALLGTSLAVQMAFDAWRGVLTGCHRWDYYNALNAGGYALTAIVMLITLLLGGHLWHIATVYLIFTIITEIVRYIVARRVCPELNLEVRYVNYKDAKKVVRFGLKTILAAVPSIVTVQTVTILVLAKLGPAALAVLMRPLALASQVSSLASKYSYVLTPAAGSLQSQDKFDELKQFALQSARSGWLIAIVPLVFLFVVGDLVVALWMGPGYADWKTMAVLSGGFLLPISQSPVMRIMVGLDQHGKIAKAGLVVTFSMLLIGLAVLSVFGWSLFGAAALIAIPIGLGTGFTVLFYGYRYLNVSAAEYFDKVLRDGFAAAGCSWIPVGNQPPSITIAANRDPCYERHYHVRSRLCAS